MAPVPFSCTISHSHQTFTTWAFIIPPSWSQVVSRSMKLTSYRHRQVALLTFFFCLARGREGSRRRNINRRLHCQKVQWLHRHISGQRCRWDCRGHCPCWFFLAANSTTFIHMPACIRFLQSRRSGLTRRTKISIMIFYQYAYFIIVLSYLRIHKSLSFMVQILVLTEHKWSTLNHPNICRTWSLTSSNQPVTAIANLQCLGSATATSRHR